MLRSMLIAALEESREVENMPDADCDDPEEWDFLIECAEGRILYDRDWEDEDLYVDLSVDMADTCYEFMGIDEDYYTAIAPEPLDEEIPGMIKRLRQLTAEPKES